MSGAYSSAVNQVLLGGRASHSPTGIASERCDRKTRVVPLEEGGMELESEARRNGRTRLPSYR